MLFVVDKGLWKIPRGRKDLFFNNSGYELLSFFLLFWTELISSIRYLICIGNLMDTSFNKHLFSILCAFILTNILRGNKGFELFIIIFSLKWTLLVSIYFYSNFFYDLFKDLIIYVGEVLVHLYKPYALSIAFLKKSNDVSLSSSFDKVLVLSRLRIIYFYLWFLLS